MTERVPPAPSSSPERDNRPIVAVFRAPLFNASETFVRGQATGLVRYQPLVVGLERIGNIPAELRDRLMLPHSARERLAAKWLGRWGSFGDRIAAIRPALVHAHFGPDGLLAMPLARRLGVPLVTTLRGYDVGRPAIALIRSGRLSWIRYALARDKLMRGGDLFLAVSDALRRAAIGDGYPADRIFTHYNGVDLAAFPPGGSAEGQTVLHVGRLVEKKGTAVLLRAFAKLAPDFPGAQLVIVGDGPLRVSLEGLAGELGLGRSVRFLGALPTHQVAEWMRASAIVAVPSCVARDGDAEGLPNVAVEAAASGRPVVGSDHRGIPEAVVDGRSGFLVPEGEAEPLARRLAELLADAELRRRMGSAGRALAEERFDAARQMQRLEQLYDGLLAERLPTATSAIDAR